MLYKQQATCHDHLLFVQKSKRFHMLDFKCGIKISYFVVSFPPSTMLRFVLTFLKLALLAHAVTAHIGSESEQRLTLIYH